MTNPQPVAKDEPEKIVLANISEYGWHCVNIIEDNGCPPWSFTIGLYETWNHPELIIIGRRSPSGRAVRMSLSSPGTGESGARARLASRILWRSADESVVTSM